MTANILKNGFRQEEKSRDSASCRSENAQIESSADLSLDTIDRLFVQMDRALEAVDRGDKDEEATESVSEFLPPDNSRPRGRLRMGRDLSAAALARVRASAGSRFCRRLALL